MTEQEQLVIVGELTRQFASNNILGIYLYGSRADGTAKTDSDWDIGLLAKPRPTL